MLVGIASVLEQGRVTSNPPVDPETEGRGGRIAQVEACKTRSGSWIA